jgi:transposase-like protein
MSIKRRKYDREFKLEAIRVFENGERSMSDVERELGITSGMLGR